MQTVVKKLPPWIRRRQPTQGGSCVNRGSLLDRLYQEVSRNVNTYQQKKLGANEQSQS